MEIDTNIDAMSENSFHMEEDDDSVNQDNHVNFADPSGSTRKRKLNEKCKKVKKLKRDTKMVPPSAEEMIQLKETENLFKSNLMRLEIEEMIKEIKPLKVFRKAAKVWIEQFKKFATQLEILEEKSLDDLSWLNEYGVSIPLPVNKRNIKGKFRFKPPIDVKPIGSYSAGCLMGPKFTVDVAVIMPKAFIYKKDHLNHVYYVKRALYLCVLCGMLKKSDLLSPDSDMEFWTPSGDSLKPVLVLNPNGKAAGHIEVFIHAIPPSDSIELPQLAPHKNSLRNEWWGVSSLILGMQPTPFYNNSILEDIIMESNEVLRAEAFEGNDSMKEAVSLLRVWLRQRELDQGYGCFSTYLMSMLIVYLKDQLILNKFMSSYQVVRNVWLYLSTADWTSNGISLSKAGIEELPAISVFHGYFEVVFIDPSGYCNLTARMSRLTFLKVKHEASLAIQLLDNTSINGFQALFMVKMPFIRQYDHLICFNDNGTLLKAVNDNTCTGSEADFNDHPVPQIVKLVSDVLTTGLNNRASQISVLPFQTPRWSVGAKCKSNRLCEVLLFGIKLDPEKAVSIIEKGPAGNLPEAEDFREMWKGKYELRRFRDGTVCEAVVWEEPESTIQDRMLITKKIVHYLFKNKLNIEENDYLYIADQMNCILTPSKGRELHNDVVSAKVHKSLEDLTSTLMGLRSIPLQIISVSCISPVYRYTDVNPPLPPSMNLIGNPVNGNSCRMMTLPPSLPDDTVPPFVPTIDLVAEMAFSKKWPNDLKACRRLTAAFYIAIAKELHRFNLKYILQTDCLIIRKDDFMFRMFLGYSKEIALLKMKISKEGVTQYRDNPESIEMEKKFVNLPKITGALHGLSLRWPSFGATARLAKRWISSQMLDESHFPSIVTELIVASLYLSPEPYSPTLQPLTMFLRFLAVLSSTNWHLEPLIVNFNNILTRDEIRLIETRFTKERSRLPSLFLVTPYDPSGSLWTKEVPTLTTLVRLPLLASTSLQILEVSFVSTKTMNHILPIFNPAMHIYDAVILLNSKMVSRSYQQILCGQTYKADEYALSDILPITRFDPPQLYLKELRDSYGEFALFFYDEFGGFKIGVLFKPQIFEHVEFSVSTAGGRKPTSTDNDKPLEINISAILNDFKELGRDFVNDVTISDKLKNIMKCL